jgi:hypothetical protein
MYRTRTLCVCGESTGFQSLFARHLPTDFTSFSSIPLKKGLLLTVTHFVLLNFADIHDV